MCTRCKKSPKKFFFYFCSAFSSTWTSTGSRPYFVGREEKRYYVNHTYTGVNCGEEIIYEKTKKQIEKRPIQSLSVVKRRFTFIY